MIKLCQEEILTKSSLLMIEHFLKINIRKSREKCYATAVKILVKNFILVLHVLNKIYSKILDYCVLKILIGREV